MATLRQIQANRRNALKSTGPRTLQGKAVSRFNALQSGIDSISEIIRGEDYNELAELACDYYHRWRPVLPEERVLVDALVHAEWELRRLRKVEAHLWSHYEAVSVGWDGSKSYAHLGMIFERGAGDFMRLQRRMDATLRAYHLNLEKLQAMEEQVADVEEEQPEPAAPVEVTSIGFVPSEPVEQPVEEPVEQPSGPAVMPVEQASQPPFPPSDPPAEQDGPLPGGCEPPQAA
jgi:hypothetical protein